MRYSHQRELILREVLKRTDHPTAEQICTSLRAECPRLSLGTVYRDLNTLVEIGKIRRVSIPGEADRFDGQTECHQHLWCTKCHQVESLYIDPAKLSDCVRPLQQMCGRRRAVSGPEPGLGRSNRMDCDIRPAARRYTERFRRSSFFAPAISYVCGRVSLCKNRTPSFHNGVRFVIS